jgi:hypothetical protein
MFFRFEDKRFLPNDNKTIEEPRRSRARRFRLVCYALAALFLVIGGLRLATSALPLIDPLLTTAHFECDPCVVRTDPVLLLGPNSARLKAWRTPGSEERISQRIRRTDVKLMLFAAQAVRAVPFFVLFLGLAMALRSFARTGFSPAGVRWIRRASLGAVGWTLAQPVSTSIRWTALSPITHGRELRHVVVGSDQLIVGILIAGAAWVVVKALEEALAMQRDLEEYV